jgi:hypothetical protein
MDLGIRRLRSGSAWSWLSPELHEIIIHTLVEDAEHDAFSLASYATVCREWKSFFEAVTFARLV